MPFHFTEQKLKSLKETIKLYMIRPRAILFSTTFFCVHFSPSSLALLPRMLLIQDLSTLNFRYLECFSSKYLYPSSLTSFSSLLSVRFFPTLYTIVTALPTLHTSVMTYLYLGFFCLSASPYFQCTHTLHELRGFVLVIAKAPLPRTVSGIGM